MLQLIAALADLTALTEALTVDCMISKIMVPGPNMQVCVDRRILR